MSSLPVSARYRRAFLISIFAAFFTSACANNPTTPITPTPPPTDPPRITCPAPQMIQSAGGPVDNVAYAPTVTGGTAPVTAKCTPAAASSFPIGTTSVSCQATDAQQREDSCGFSITVVPPPPPPRLSATVFVCFGDSMTEGSNVNRPTFIPSPPNSYPADVLTLLAGRYTTQRLTVLDEGVSGEKVSEGRFRLPRVLTSDRPDALLLLEGVNDLNENGVDGIARAISGLQAMIRNARDNGVVVFLATIPPQRPGGFRAYTPTLVEPLNDRIRALAPAEGAVLVDVYHDFNGDVVGLLQDDGLHPNAAGYLRMAQSFFAAIRTTMEVVPPPSTFGSFRLPALVSLAPAATGVGHVHR
ncbi:MAG: GDSL-type esterase/lipase family protein [Acidobacteriota bacterium]